MYRIQQFLGALTARLNEGDERNLASLLTPTQRQLFRRMTPNDRRHSMNVCNALRRGGENNTDLLVAALLHDVGKAAGRIWLWQRTLIVLLQRWAPSLLSLLARGSDPSEAPGWRRGFVVNQLHPELGARWAANADCSPTTVIIIRRHQDLVESPVTNQDRLLVALQRADGVN